MSGKLRNWDAKKEMSEAEKEIENIDGRIFRIHRGLSSCENPMNAMQFLGEFENISKCLISMLPPLSIESLISVDDLVYKVQNKEANKSFIRDKPLYGHIHAELYSECYDDFLKFGVRNIFMDTALMKLSEHMPVLFKNRAHRLLLGLKDVYSTCVALKISLSQRQIEDFKFDACEITRGDFQLSVEYLKNLPQGYSPNGNRLSDFIKQHADLFLTLTKDSNICVNGVGFVKASILKMISERRFAADKYIVCLIDTFMNLNSSERDELPSYLFELFQGTDESVQEALKFMRHRSDANNTLPQKIMRVIMEHILTNIYNLRIKLLEDEEKMAHIDRFHGYKIEPYFPENKKDKYLAFNNKASMSNEALLSIEEQDQIIFKQFFVYDEFMRNLHCLSIFHELFMELERRFKVKYPKCYVYENLLDIIPTHGILPWFVKMVVMKCPFLFTSHKEEITFSDITSEEKEFIIRNWTIKIVKKENPDGYSYQDDGEVKVLPRKPCDYVDRNIDIVHRLHPFQRVRQFFSKRFNKNDPNL